MEADLTGLQTSLGRQFVHPELLLRALTHRSLAKQEAQDALDPETSRPGDNERLEFLGDAVIGLVVAEVLFQSHPEWSEGELTVVRSRLVSRQHMAQVAGKIGLGSYLRLSKGEDRGGLRRTATVLSNTMEAVLGALYIDGGLEPVKEFARHQLMAEAVEELASELHAGAALGNFKSALQEYLQAAHAGSPVYRLKGESGPEHRKRFLVEVRLRPADGEPGKPLARGVGSTKKNAEQDAARRALTRLRASAVQASQESGAGEEEDP
jgi:ribonuclease III